MSNLGKKEKINMNNKGNDSSIKWLMIRFIVDFIIKFYNYRLRWKNKIVFWVFLGKFISIFKFGLYGILGMLDCVFGLEFFKRFELIMFVLIIIFVINL